VRAFPGSDQFRLQIQDTPARSKPQFKLLGIHSLGEVVISSSIDLISPLLEVEFQDGS